MSSPTHPADTAGNEVLALLQLLYNQPPTPLRDHLIQEAAKRLLGLNGTPPYVGPEISTETSETELNQAIAGIPPIIRLPKAGQRCPYTGLSRTGLYELISPGEHNNHRPPVSAIHRKSHAQAKRGIWQIPTRGLFRYLLGQRKNTAPGYKDGGSS